MMRYLPLLFTAVFALLAACVPEGSPSSPPGSTKTTARVVGPGGLCTAAPQFEAAPLNTCAAGPKLHLAFVGDVLVHVQLQDHGYDVGFERIWGQAAAYLRNADLAIANLEGTVAAGVTQSRKQIADPGPITGTGVYSGFPFFNYHPVLLRDLKAAGVDLVTTANNHSMDRGPLGVDLTLAELARVGIAPIGTVARGAPRRFVTHRETAAGTLAFVACSFGTNGLADPNHQVLLCYKDRAQILTLVRQEAANPAVAAVIVLPHWGREYQTIPDRNQQKLAQDLVAAGATAVIGTHPHAVQPFEVMQGADGTRSLVVYSTGNFISTQDFVPSRYEAMALVDLCPSTAGSGLVVDRAGWIAMQMSLTSRGYWIDIGPKGAPGYAGEPEAFLRRVAPGFSAQPAACSPG